MPQPTTVALACLALATFGGLVPAGVSAQTAATPETPPAEPAAPLGEITNTATRTPRRVDDVPASVTVVPADEVQRRGARDIKDLFRNEIDITVRAAPARFSAAGAATGRAGNEGINIRGLEGNQVLLLVDGIRVPNSFSFGAFATGRGDFFALDSAQSVEVLRGPASTQYGSDGLAGAVSLHTLDPADVLSASRNVGGFVRLSADGIDDSAGATVAGAARGGAWQGLLLLSGRRGHEVENRGTNDSLNNSRTTPNPVDAEQQSALAKTYFQLKAAHRFGATLEALRHRQNTEVFTARALPPPAPEPLPATAVQGLDARDTVRRERLSLEHRFVDLNHPWLQKAETRLYVQDAEVEQRSFEDRNTAADRTRINSYQQNVRGLSVQLESNFGAPLTQRLSYGIDASRSEIKSLRDGTVPPQGETFPVKPFPDTDCTLAGAFVQSEIEVGAFSVMPALRFDRYKLLPSSRGYSGDVAALSDQAVTPRIGIVWRLTDSLAPYVQWSRGFRAPTPDQVNNGFTNVVQGYQTIGNPNLKPEHAQSIEAGVRGRIAELRYALAGYDNRYEDFISQQVVGGTGVPVVDPLIFQFVNLAKARIRGIELRGEWRAGTHWTMTAGSALSRGHGEISGARVPLDSAEPLRTALGVRYDAGAWGLRAQALHAQGKAANRIAPASTAPFAPPSYTVLDIGATWKPLPPLTLNVNLNNALDKTYWRWSDVRGLPDNSTVKDAYTAPGRGVQVSMRYDY